MSNSIAFSKYTGCGNDFIMIDNRDLKLPGGFKKAISKLCHRQMGIGADGVILVEPSALADIKMRIFNADGSEAEMCGNGIRCFKKYLAEIGLSAASYSVEVFNQKLTVEDFGSDVQVLIKDFISSPKVYQLPLNGRIKTCYFLDTGVPHLVFILDKADWQSLNLNAAAPPLRRHTLFLPGGTNVNICCLDDPSEIAIRTFERGVEGETLACGTGSAAGAIIAGKFFGWKSPVNVRVASGERLTFHFDIENDAIKNLSMRGPARKVYCGSFQNLF